MLGRNVIDRQFQPTGSELPGSKLAREMRQVERARIGEGGLPFATGGQRRQVGRVETLTDSIPGGCRLIAQEENALDGSCQVVSSGKAEGWQQGHGMTANVAHKAFHADEEGLLVIAGVAGVAAVAHEFAQLPAIRTNIGPVENDLGKPVAVALDI